MVSPLKPLWCLKNQEHPQNLPQSPTDKARLGNLFINLFINNDFSYSMISNITTFRISYRLNSYIPGSNSYFMI